ncbi:TIGR03668 family PPOX class F420-dependent oxidoreductase [Luteimicrobium subarcticum]|uniref:PPOX class probable F420-dependent enzyme n=1 Tax=Luteimicrobium subarcticum TaxID=620910 RepID=A0A2M8W430_9MICO|nr:TIGR03668 family PPOX class F420-dependent oxidoreductase [Luteimicrobium subarcticum]PJI85686.1 PPOX class probable F420-dependent enzyme [Luteimicrobium subarcticum]
MRIDDATCRRLLAAARHGYLATAGDDQQPRVVPVTFALVPATDEIVTAVDHKPKTTSALRRLRDVAENPRAALLVDRYDDDWSQLWWVRATGTITVERLPSDTADDTTDTDARWSAAIDVLAGKYPQYVQHRPTDAVLRLQVDRWTGWSATPIG